MLLTEAGIPCRMGEGHSTIAVDARKLTVENVATLQRLIMSQFSYLVSVSTHRFESTHKIFTPN